VILSLAVGGVNPLLLMIVYALSVSVALISVTILSVKVITTIQDKIIHYTKYLPKISAIILVIMAITFVLGLEPIPKIDRNIAACFYSLICLTFE
jgi:hypothetical protein